MKLLSDATFKMYNDFGKLYQFMFHAQTVITDRG